MIKFTCLGLAMEPTVVSRPESMRQVVLEVDNYYASVFLMDFNLTRPSFTMVLSGSAGSAGFASSADARSLFQFLSAL